MATWHDLVAGGADLFLVIDDLIAALLTPGRRHQVQSYSLMTAAEFLAMELPSENRHLVLTSMLPEIHEAAFFTGMYLDSPYCHKLYEESFAGLLRTHERQELELSYYPSVTEVAYPQLALATLILALGAESYQGGEEMFGYLAPLRAIADRMGRGVPDMLPGRATFVLGSDGNHMASENAVYLSAPKDVLMNQVDGIVDSQVLRSWFEALSADRIEFDDIDEGRARLRSLLPEVLTPFRENRRTHEEIVAALEAGSIETRLRLRDFLMEIKRDHAIPGFVRG